MKIKITYIRTGESRIKSKFAIFPITCNLQGEMYKELRWLCFVKYQQTYLHDRWVNSWWIDK